MEHVATAKPFALDRGLHPGQPLLDPALEAVVDRGFFLPPIGGAAEDEGVFAPIGGVDALDLDPFPDCLPLPFEKRRLHLAQESARRADEVQPSRSV